jgi:hypothetical protein
MRLRTGLFPEFQRPSFRHIVSQIKPLDGNSWPELRSVPGPSCEGSGVSRLPAGWYTDSLIRLIGFGVNEKLEGTQ